MATSSISLMNELQITKAALAIGWVKFSYTKADGTKRVAIGTTNRALIESFTGSKLADDEHSPYYPSNTSVYYDLSRMEFRSFRNDRFIGLELDRLNNEKAVAIAMSIAYTDLHCSEIHYQHLKVMCRDFVGVDIVISIEREMRDAVAEDADDMVVAVETAAIRAASVYSKPSNTREQLIKELMQLRQRESEILSQLLSA